MSGRSRLETVALVGLVVLLAVGLGRAIALAWVCDDSFISFRYAENLVEGHGLVYNPGERVEGYTNLLWTLLLAALIKIGAPPIAAAEVSGIIAYLWLALCLAHFSRRQSRIASRPYLPLAAGLVLVLDDFHVWATGGLETMLFTALAVQALVLTRLEGPTPRRSLLAGALLALLVLTRPDGLVFASAGAVSYWVPPSRLPRETRLRHSLATLAPVAAVLAVLLPWKLSYYGDLFPTAFYSKSVLRPYYAQGIVYVGVYLVKNWFLLVAGVLGLTAFVRGRHDEVPLESRWDDRFFLGTCALFTAYLVHTGGDFMFARRLIPALPLLFLVLENRAARWPKPRTRAALAVLGLAAAALPLPIFEHWSRINGIGDEHRFYPAKIVEARKRQAEAVARALAGTPARVAFEGGMCVFGYYSQLPYLVEITGLTQYSLAKRPLAERGFIGHEKVADSGWLTENEIHFVVSHQEPPVSRPPGVLSLDEIYFGDVAKARIQIYSHAVMDPLRERPDLDFVPIERVIELSRQHMEELSLGEAERRYQDLQRFYFHRAGARGEALERKLLELLEQKRREAEPTKASQPLRDRVRYAR